MITKFQITNITCDACVKLSKNILKNLPSVKKVEIDNSGLATIESGDNLSWEEIKNTLAKIDKNAFLI